MVGGAHMRDPAEAYKRISGFRNQYSTTNSAEDKADIWSAIILYPLFGICNTEENN